MSRSQADNHVAEVRGSDERPCLGSDPVLSVVMPIRNEASWIVRTLVQLLAQEFDPRSVEILVVDGESTDGTPGLVAAVASRNPRVRLLANPRKLSSAARNIGVKAARGQFILIVDGHCEIKTPWLFRNVVQAFCQSGADCLGRPQPLDVTGASRLQEAIALARGSWLGHHPDSFIYSEQPRFAPAHSVAVAYRREVFDQVGYFDESFDACEDVEFNTRVDSAGLRCYFTPEIAVHYVPRASLMGLFKQLSRYGRGRVRLMRKHPDLRSVKAFVPALFVCGVLVGLPLSIVAATASVVYVGVILLYATMLFSVSFVLAVKYRKWLLWPFLPAVFLTIHAGCGLGAIREACTIQKTNRGAHQGTLGRPRPAVDAGVNTAGVDHLGK